MRSKDKSQPDIHIFLSYAKEDSRSGAKLRNLLAQKPNFHVFTSHELSAGENWRLKIKKALLKSDYFLVLLSPKSVESRWVLFELSAAWGLYKRIIPVVTNPEVVSRIPLKLGDLVELKQLKKPESITQIMESYAKTAA